MTTDLAGTNKTFTFSKAGIVADPNAPYKNSTGAALLTLNETNATALVNEASGAFSDSGGSLAVMFEGVGQFSLGGVNVYSGATFLAGTTRVSVAVSGALGTGDIYFYAGATTPELDSLGAYATSQSINVFFGVSPRLAAGTGASLTANGFFSDQGGAGTTLHFGYSGATGTVTLNTSSVAADAAGGLSVDGGTLQLASASAATLVSTLTGGLNVTGTLDLDGQAVTLSKLTGTGTISNSAATAATLTFNNTNQINFNGAVSGAINLNLNGAEVDLLGQTAVTSATISFSHLTIGNGTPGVTFSGDVIDNGELEFYVSGSLTYAQNLSGAGLLYIFTGGITLSGDNSGFTGILRDAGKVSLATASALGASSEIDLIYSTLEAEADLNSNARLILVYSSVIEATAGHTLTLTGPFADQGDDGGDFRVGNSLTIGSATDTGTVVLGNGGNGGDVGFQFGGAVLEIDGGTLDLQSNLSLNNNVSLALAGGAFEAIDNRTISTSITIGAGSTLEAKAGLTLTVAGAFTDTAAAGATIHIGSATDTGTVVLGNSGGQGIVNAVSLIEIDGGTLNVQSGFSLAKADLLFKGNTGTLILNATASASSVSSSAGASGTVDLNAAQVAFTGGGEAVNLDGSSTNVATLFATGSNYDTVTGSNGSIVLDGAEAVINGGNDTITLDGSPSDYANLYNTGANYDTVYGYDGRIGLNSAVAVIVGGDDTITMDKSGSDYANLYNTGGNYDTVLGTNGGRIGLNNAVAAIGGGGFSIQMDGNASDYANLYNTGSNYDTVIGSNGKVGLNSAVAAIGGGGYTIQMDGNASDYANLFNTGSNYDTVLGSNGKVGLNSAVAAIGGGGFSIQMDGSTSDYANLYNTGANYDTVIGSNGKIGLNGVVAAVGGNNDTLDFNSGVNTAVLNGTGEAFVFSAKFGVDSIFNLAASDAYYFAVGDFANFAALHSKMTQSGGDTLISLDANDSVRLVGVNMNSLSASQFHFS